MVTSKTGHNTERPPSLCLIADDLTGALDSASEFVALCGPVRVSWDEPVFGDVRCRAYDTETREMPAGDAARRSAAAAASLHLADADLAFFKVDSLLRGHAGHELAACLDVAAFDRVAVAPAFPFQKRRAVAGRQQALVGGRWTVVGEDIATTLRRLGRAVVPRVPGDPMPEGISFWDATTDDHLTAVVQAGRQAGGRVLWCGSGGLAHAIAGRTGAAAPSLAPPVLGIFGTDHPVTLEQIACVSESVIRVASGDDTVAAVVAGRLATGAVIVHFALPSGTPRPQAARAIAGRLNDLVSHLRPPGTVVCGGGETLRSLCRAIGAEGLDVSGSWMPGVSVSRVRGGQWDGVAVVSKSGAFGRPHFLADFLAAVEQPSLVATRQKRRRPYPPVA